MHAVARTPTRVAITEARPRVAAMPRNHSLGGQVAPRQYDRTRFRESRDQGSCQYQGLASLPMPSSDGIHRRMLDELIRSNAVDKRWAEELIAGVQPEPTAVGVAWT